MPAPAAHQQGAPPAPAHLNPWNSPPPALQPHRFDDRVTGKLEAFATHARIIHIDVDPAEIHKNKHAHIPLCADVKPALRLLNRLLEQEPIDTGLYEAWRQDLDNKKVEFPMRYPERDDVIIPQHAVEVRSRGWYRELMRMAVPVASVCCAGVGSTWQGSSATAYVLNQAGGRCCSMPIVPVYTRWSCLTPHHLALPPAGAV